jgi:hypothetical protein
MGKPTTIALPEVDAPSNGNSTDVAGVGIHLSLQGKGGVGKSLVASILAQYFTARNRPVQCIDTDPVNSTLSQYRALNVERLNVLNENTVDQRIFDVLMERLLTQEGTFVIDNGASTFIPLWAYIVDNGVIDLLRRSGRRIYVHTVLTGGHGLLDTLSGFKSLAINTETRNIVVWLNNYFGPIEAEGKRFNDMTVYRDHNDRVFGTVLLPKKNPDTFGRDLEEVIARKLTISEAIDHREFTIMTRQRLKIIQREWFEQLEKLGF